MVRAVRITCRLMLASVLAWPLSVVAAETGGIVGPSLLETADTQMPQPRITRPADETPATPPTVDIISPDPVASDPLAPGEPIPPDPAPPVFADPVPTPPDADRWRSLGTPAPIPDDPPVPAAPATSPAAEDPARQPADVVPLEELPDWREAPAPDEILIDADQIYYVAGATIAEGNVTVRYRGITIRSQVAEIDEDGILGQFREDVVITYEDRETTANLILFNFETEQWQVLDARTIFEPEFFERGVAAPIFVRAGTIAGTGEEEVVEAFDAHATSCDLIDPHWGLYSEHIRIVGDEQIVLEKPAFRLFGSTVFRYPWDIVLSQRSPHNRIFPEFGQNTVEGFYAKIAYLYLASGDLNSFLRLHLTERRGIGAGANHYFRTGPHAGEASVFYEPDEGAFNSRVRHDWAISERLRSNLNASLQQNSGFAGPTTSLASNLNLHHRGDRSSTTLGLDRSITDSVHVTSGRFGANINHRQDIGAGASWNMRSTLRRSERGAGIPVHETLQGDFRFQQRLDRFDWAVAASDEWYLNSEQPRSFGIAQLPEIVFNTDSRRLGDWRVLGAIPFRTSVRTGHVVQYPDEQGITFAAIDTNFGGERISVARNAVLTTTMSFNQAFYSPDAARFTLGGTLGLNAELGSNLFARLSHRAATVGGFSPLRRDYAGVYNDSSVSFVHQRRNLSRFELTGGFDFVDDRWRELRLRGWMTPSRTDRIELMAGYALEQSIWRPLQMRWTHATPWQIYMALSTRYDLERTELDSADLEFDWRVDDLWRLQGITTYSGQRGEFRNMNLRITRDLHCWVASLTYNADFNELRLNLGIKAFPFEDRDWTLGQTGARLGSHQQYYY